MTSETPKNETGFLGLPRHVFDALVFPYFEVVPPVGVLYSWGRGVCGLPMLVSGDEVFEVPLGSAVPGQPVVLLHQDVHPVSLLGGVEILLILRVLSVTV